MLRLPWLLLFLLLLVSFPTFSAEVGEMTDAEIADHFLAIYDELETAYQAHLQLYGTVARLSPRLQTISESLQTAAAAMKSTQDSMKQIGNDFRDYEKDVENRIRDVTIRSYVIGIVTILAALLIVLVT